jgi:phenylacetate-CoA ligase
MTQHTDAERYPTLSAAGEAMLRRLREHPHAPIYENQSGNKLRPDDIARVLAFERAILDDRTTPSLAPPSWTADFVEECYRDVPFYRNYPAKKPDFANVPPVSRADLSRDIAAFVPDSAPLDRMINFRTSGTTGHPLLLASHPVVAASYLAFHKRALRRFGVELTAGVGQVGVVLVGFQRKCFTYTSVTPTMGESGLAKINLHPDDWRSPDDRAAYLNDLEPEVLTGDPVSFQELLNLPTKCRPRALLSTSMALLPGLRARLEERFACPVLDLYSMNEAGPVAVFDPASGGHVALQPRLFLELLGPDLRPVAPGERGEITLTGGFNFCLPLLRYRTGDYASLRIDGHDAILDRLEGRPPVCFLSQHGEWLNNVDLTHALGPLALSRYRVHQRSDGSLDLHLPSGFSEADRAQRALRELFGSDQMVQVLELDDDHDDKVVQYTSELAS